ncbi:4-aminobutyrate--2-oxoglutarate transaminase [Phenylobacterium sp. J367]|uniref:4-aminobutyrate--2-oxoglutarate transaminase n=1 Tax=Phenylobacterium sp. J367 TaxID=2898435 RepID=UPI002151127B|nr:4-aminobutyrate--2-oxoglutarate transaminase [Phenylobacterium sp. J367]MCR5880674.1 4-aminobutyrate--2-oxoglutarate transaminase [Phenylobacterium sp. J367]
MSANADLHARRTAAVPRGVANATAVYAARAENAELWDAEGRRYVDFAGGIAVLNVGHRHPRVIEAVQRQLDLYTHTAFQIVPYEPYIALAERLNAVAPIDGPAKTIFFTTGAEAVENTVKIARAATGRSAVIAFVNGFHGRTQLTMGLTGKVAPYKRGFGPGPAEVYHLPFPNDRYGVSLDDTLRALQFLFAADVAPDRVAAIILEPVQGEGGFNPVPVELMSALRALCDEHGILLIADEVQTGFARTGKLFAMEHYSVKADLISVAKSMAGGFPLSGVIGRAEIMDRVDPGGLGGTYGGSPVACAAALAVLDVIEAEGLVERANVVGAALTERLRSFTTRNDLLPVSPPRGPGAMVAFDVLASHGSREPDGAAAKALTGRALEKGLVILSCGQFGETIRILVPLTASDAVIEEGMDILEAALAAPQDA